MRIRQESNYPPGPSERIPFTLALKLLSNPLDLLSGFAHTYGDLTHFKFGRQHAYLLNNPDYIEDVLVTNNSKFIKNPGLKLAKRILGEGLLTSEGEFHARQRRLIQPAFYKNRLEKYASVVYGCCSSHIGNKDWKDGAEIDIHKEMTYLSLAIINRILFGSGISGSEVQDASKSITILIKYINLLRFPPTRIIEKLPLPITLEYRNAKRKLDSLIYEKIKQRRNMPVDNKPSTFDSAEPFEGRNKNAMQNRGAEADMLSILLGTSDEQSSDGNKPITMSDSQLKDEVMTLFLAGHETTANALAWAFYLISQHQEVESKLVSEIDSVVGHSHDENDACDITFDHVSRLKYAETVITESMRLYPPTWAIARQVAQGYSIGKYHICPGSVLIMSQYLMHQDPRYYNQPKRFYPERWTAKFKASIPRFSYFPFGGGSRSCMGEPFAWMETVLVLATVLRRWKMQVTPDPPIVLQPLVTLRPKFGIRMKLTDRWADN